MSLAFHIYFIIQREWLTLSIVFNVVLCFRTVQLFDIDRAVKSIVDAYKMHGMWENTLTIFTAGLLSHACYSVM